MLLTEEEAAAKAKVSPRTIRRLILAGRLKATPFGLGRRPMYRIEEDSLTHMTGVPEAHVEVPVVRRRRRAVVAPTAATPFKFQMP